MMKNKQNTGKNKRNLILVFLIFIVIIIILIFLLKNNYKISNLGNNMSNKNIEEIEKYILDISSYEATIDVTVESNKNTNKYLIKQEYIKDTISKQTVLEPSNIEGMEIIYKNNTLKLNNTRLNLSSVYENYNFAVDNYMWLDSFIQDYKNGKESNNTTLKEENDIVTMKVNLQNQNNKYICNKTLYIDKKAGKPTKLVIQDINKKNLVYILYNEITLNGLY